MTKDQPETANTFVVCDLSDRGAVVYCGPDRAEAVRVYDSLESAYLAEQYRWDNGFGMAQTTLATVQK